MLEVARRDQGYARLWAGVRHRRETSVLEAPCFVERPQSCREDGTGTVCRIPSVRLPLGCCRETVLSGRPAAGSGDGSHTRTVGGQGVPGRLRLSKPSLPRTRGWSWPQSVFRLRAHTTESRPVRPAPDFTTVSSAWNSLGSVGDSIKSCGVSFRGVWPPTHGWGLARFSEQELRSGAGVFRRNRIRTDESGAPVSPFLLLDRNVSPVASPPRYLGDTTGLVPWLTAGGLSL